MESYRLRTPEAINLSYDLAGIGSRGLALMIDTAIIAVVTIGIIVAAVLFATSGGDETVAGIAALSLIFLLWFGYFIAFETLWEGQTPGKRILGIRVLKTTGYPVGLVEALVRNIVRLADMLPSLYALGLIVMFLSPQSRRLGDYAAGTVVIKERGRVTPPGGSGRVPETGRAERGAQDEEEWGWDLAGLREGDISTVRAFLERAPGLAPEARRRVATEMGERVRAIIGAREPLDEERFLRRVVDLWTEDARR